MLLIFLGFQPKAEQKQLLVRKSKEQTLRQLRQLFIFKRRPWISKTQFTNEIHRDEMDVCMRYFQSRNHHADANAFHFLLQYFRYLLAEEHHVLQQFIRHIEDVIDLLFGHYQDMAKHDRPYIEKGKAAIIFRYFVARNFAIDDAGKDGRHDAVRLKGNV